MADRTIEQMPANVPEFEGILEAVLLQALEIGQEKLEAGEELVPFTALAVGETLFMETHPGSDSDECFAAAAHTVQNARGAAAYAFCYDGYVETDDGELDAIIAEGGLPGAQTGHAIACLYTVDGEEENARYTIDPQALYIGQTPNFMEFTLVLGPEDEAEEGASQEDSEEIQDVPDALDVSDMPDTLDGLDGPNAQDAADVASVPVFENEPGEAEDRAALGMQE